MRGCVRIGAHVFMCARSVRMRTLVCVCVCVCVHVQSPACV